MRELLDGGIALARGLALYFVTRRVR